MRKLRPTSQLARLPGRKRATRKPAPIPDGIECYARPAGAGGLFDPQTAPFARISFEIIIPVVAVTAACCIITVYLAVKAYRRKPATGREGIVGEVGIAKSAIDPEGKVFVHGEYWDALSDEPIPQGSAVKVVSVGSIKLKVTRTEPSPTNRCKKEEI